MKQTGLSIELEGVVKDFASEPVLRELSVCIQGGEFVSITGPSGCGKSTLLNVIAGLERPSRGLVRVGGRDLYSMGLLERDRFRLDSVSFVFQFFHLLPTLTALENVLLPAFEKSISRAERRETERFAVDLIDRLGLGPHGNKFPSELSGGMQSRFGFARAIVAKPRLLLADEPTGSLDQTSGHALLDLLCDYQRESGCTVVLVTHDSMAAARAKRALRLVDGRWDKGPSESERVSDERHSEGEAQL